MFLNGIFFFIKTTEVCNVADESTIYKWGPNSCDKICITSKNNAKLLAVTADDILNF